MDDHLSNPADGDLVALITGYCNETLDDAQMAQLDFLLTHDADAAKLFVRYLGIHGRLLWKFHGKGQPRHEQSAGVAGDSRFTAPTTPKAVVRKNSLSGIALRLNRPLPFALITSTVVVLAFLSFARMTTYLPVRLAQPSPAPPAARLPVAEVADTAHAQGSTLAGALASGQTLLAGDWLRVSRGWAAISFNDGARVILEGPAEFRVSSAGSGDLHFGRIVASTPAHARGFTIRSGAATIIDWGTEFGVNASQRGGLEVVVFSGKVEVATEQSNHRSSRMLEKGQTLSYPTQSEASAPLVTQATSTRYVRSLAEARTRIPDSKFIPRKDRLAVWLTSEYGVVSDAAQRVGSWNSVMGGKAARQDVLAHQPLLEPVGIEGPPALRFEGDDFLQLPSAVDLGLVLSDYEIFVVATSQDPGVQFLVAGGITNVELAINHYRDDLGARFIPRAPFQLEEAADRGRQGEYTDGRPHLFNARVDAAQGHRALIRVDGGESAATSDADARMTDGTALRIGLRQDATFGMKGLISEVMIFNQSLTDPERRKVESYLCRKYAIPLPQSDE